MIHELTTLEIKVFSNAKVYAALQERLPAAGGTLLGAFATDIGAWPSGAWRASTLASTRSQNSAISGRSSAHSAARSAGASAPA